eukprot:gene22-73_t
MDKAERHQLESIQEAEEYLKKHRIHELFNDMCASLCFQKPTNVKDFLVSELKKREANPEKASMLFEDSEIEAVFRMADLMQVGSITVDQAKQALGSLVNTQAQQAVVEGLTFTGDRVDLEMFRAKVTSVFA